MDVKQVVAKAATYVAEMESMTRTYFSLLLTTRASCRHVPQRWPSKMLTVS